MNKGILYFLISATVVTFSISSYLWLHNPKIEPITINHIQPGPEQTAPPLRQAIPATNPVDPRAAQLQAFFDHYHCKDGIYLQKYLEVADKFGLDYRLLPAISLKESSCGLHYKNNNIFGWASAEKKFDSIDQGIEFVGDHLANFSPYVGKTLNQKLYYYNNHPGYVESVKAIMNFMVAE